MQRDEELLVALRKVIRAIDLRSKQLSKDAGLTGPQLIVMQSIGKEPGIMVRQVAQNICFLSRYAFHARRESLGNVPPQWPPTPCLRPSPPKSSLPLVASASGPLGTKLPGIGGRNL